MDADRTVEHDAAPELAQICRRAVRELGLMGAAVSLMSDTGSEAIAAVSPEKIRPVEELQFSMGEGPCRDAYAAGRPVLTRDIETAFGTWPGYAPAAISAGVGAVFAFPLLLGAAKFGVLTLYSARPRALDNAEISASLIFAEVANEALLDGSRPVPALPGYGGSLSTIPSGLQFRNEVYQAQGMVMVDLGVSLADALARMRAHAYATGEDLTLLALDIIAGRIRLSPDGARKHDQRDNDNGA